MEPDEKRWGIEMGGINSFSSRITVSPGKRWSGQVSIGRINNRETTHPVRDSLRTSSSLMYTRPFAGGHWASSLIWGRNVDLEFTQPPISPNAFALKAPVADTFTFQPLHLVTVPTRIPRQIYNSYLAESTVRWRRRNWAWGRWENVDRTSLLLYQEDPFVILVEERRFARVQALTLGYERELPWQTRWLNTGIGAQTTFYSVPEILPDLWLASPGRAAFHPDAAARRTAVNGLFLNRHLAQSP